MRVELQIGKAQTVSQSRLAALLIMPLLFAPLRLAAQMIAVAPEPDPAVTDALAAQTRLYLNSSDVRTQSLVDLKATSDPSNPSLATATPDATSPRTDPTDGASSAETSASSAPALSTAANPDPSPATSPVATLPALTTSSAAASAPVQTKGEVATAPTCFVPPTGLAPTSRSTAPLLSDEAILAAAATARPVAPVISDEDILAAAIAARSTPAAIPAEIASTPVHPAISSSDEALLASAAAAHSAAPVANDAPPPPIIGRPVLSSADEALLAAAAAAHNAVPPAVPGSVMASVEAPIAPAPAVVARVEIPAPAPIASAAPIGVSPDPTPAAAPAATSTPEASPAASSTSAPAPAADPAPAAAPAAGDPTASPDPAPSPVTLPPKPLKAHDLAQSGDRDRVRPFQAAAFGITAGSLGSGGELAIPIARTLNLRVGASYLLWHYPFNIDGIDYNPGLKFTSGRATIDWFPHHGAFHISAGALYFRNTIGGSADVVEGQTFSLGGTNYINSVDDPIHGTATVTYGKQIAPLVLLGFGNILPRSGRHLSMPFEFGGAYMQPPTLNLNLKGTACTNQGCFNAATDPEVHGNLVKEINKLQGDIHFLQVFPVVSLGLACRF